MDLGYSLVASQPMRDIPTAGSFLGIDSWSSLTEGVLHKAKRVSWGCGVVGNRCTLIH